MLKVPILAPTELDRAANIFHRDGFVCIKDTLTPDQLKFAQAGAARIIKEQTDADPERKGNRGSFRYSFGQPDNAARIEKAVDMVLAQGFRTGDIMQPGMNQVGTMAMTNAILKALDATV